MSNFEQTAMRATERQCRHGRAAHTGRGFVHGAAAAAAIAVGFVGQLLAGPVGVSADFIAKAQAAPAAAPRHGVQYGVVEVGSKGVKAYLFDLQYAQTGPGCNADPEAHLKCLNEITLPQINADAVERSRMQAVADAVKGMKETLKTTYGVKEENLYVVGSSGVYDVEHRPALSELINRVAELGPGHQIDYITKDDEASYSFKGLMAMLPKPYNVTRRTQAIVIDFGSGNTKGSYSETADYSKPLATFAVPWGTKTVTDSIDQSRGSAGEFTPAAEKFRESVLVPQMRTQFQDETSAMSRPRVYVIGGIIWAISNLSEPKLRYTKKFPPMTQVDIDSVYSKAAADDGFSKLCGNNPDKNIDPDIVDICKTFTINNLISGSELVRSYAKEMDFAHKNVFFFRDSLYAWPMGYLEHRVYPSARG